jgi:hypothetical protein
MTTTPNRHYSLPSRHHDVVDDINDLRTTFGKVDEDIVDIENAVTELSDDVSDTQATVIHTDSVLENSEIQNIAPNRYLVVNRTGDGFECLDGGGDAGGKTGQCSIKKSDQEFDTAWGDISEVSKNGMTVKENAEASESGETHIFVDETEIDNDKQFPKVELTNCQAKADFKSDSNSSVIICDTIEEVKEEIQTATNLNYGFIKVGNGLSVDNGTLSAPVYSAATVDDFGLIKTGSGLNNNDGVISYDAISPATPSSFGVVKLGENLKINTNGEMEIDDMGTSATIYDLGNVKVCNNGIVELEEATLRYRLFVTEDLVIQFALDFEPRDDFSFVLDLVSDGTHLVAFDDELYPEMTTLSINRGITKITFTKKLGVPSYNFEISRLDAPEPTLLTPSMGSCISSKFSVTSGGGSWVPNGILKTSYSSYCDIRELNFKFETLVCVDYVNYLSRSSSAAMGEFILRGSNDGKNWTTLIYKNGEIIYGKIYTELKGCFRYFNLKIGYTSDDNKPGGVTLWGTQIDNNESEIIPITPFMSSNETTFAKMTANNIESGSAANITDFNCDSLLKMTKSGDDWIKYELSEAKVANILELNFRGTGEYYGFYGDRHPNWFKLEGSNDDETWTLLLERQYAGNELARNNNIVFYNFENNNAYKYYKFTCVATNSSSTQWGVCGLKLYRRDVGKHNFYRGVPKLASANQDGYEVSSSSVYNEVNNSALKAFDDESSTRWVGLGASDVWLQVKLPAAQAFNTFKIVARNDEYLNESPQNFSLQGSNDEENWDTLSTTTGCSWTSGEIKTFSFNNETPYEYYRLYISTNCGGTNTGISGFILGNRVHEYKRYLNKYDYLVPVLSGMTTNASDGTYVVSASSCDEYGQVWYPFSRSHDNFLELAGSTTGWIKIQLPEARIANLMQIGSRGGSYSGDTPRNYSLYGSNDGATWDILFSVENSASWSSSELRRHDFENETAYLYYRLNFSNPSLRSVCSVARWELIRHYAIQEY